MAVDKKDDVPKHQKLAIAAPKSDNVSRSTGSVPIIIIVLLALLAGTTFAIYFCFFRSKRGISFDRQTEDFVEMR